MNNNRLSRLSQTVRPKTLYHGSIFLEKKALRPGYEYSGRLVEWDNGESNHFLYATTSKIDATILGIASAIEHKFQLDEFHSKNNQITLISPNQELTLDDIYQLDVYLYEIAFNPVSWIKNSNPDNNLHTEWKTEQHITDFKQTKVDVEKFLKDYDVVVNPTTR